MSVAALSLWVKLVVPTQRSHLPQRIARISSQGNAAPRWRLSYRTNPGLDKTTSGAAQPAVQLSLPLVFLLRVNVHTHIYSWETLLLTPVIFSLFCWMNSDLMVIWQIICLCFWGTQENIFYYLNYYWNAGVDTASTAKARPSWKSVHKEAASLCGGSEMSVGWTAMILRTYIHTPQQDKL